MGTGEIILLSLCMIIVIAGMIFARISSKQVQNFDKLNKKDDNKK